MSRRPEEEFETGRFRQRYDGCLNWKATQNWHWRVHDGWWAREKRSYSDSHRQNGLKFFSSHSTLENGLFLVFYFSVSVSLPVLFAVTFKATWMSFCSLPPNNPWCNPKGRGLPGCLVVKNSPCNEWDVDSISGREIKSPAVEQESLHGPREDCNKDPTQPNKYVFKKC